MTISIARAAFSLIAVFSPDLFHAGVPLIVKMSSRASIDQSRSGSNSCDGCLRHAKSAPQVFLSGNSFEVIRIHTATDAAQMIQIKPRRDRSAIERVSHPVCQSNLLLVIANHSVPSMVQAAKKYPAAAHRLWGNHFRKSVDGAHEVYFTVYTSLKSKLFAAALQNAHLVYLLGSGSPLVLRWFDQQLQQSAGSPFPAVVVSQVSNPSDYATTGILPTSWVRMQFTVYGTGPDSQNADVIVQALSDFLGTFNGDGVLNRVASPNFIINDRDMGVAKTQPLTYMRVVDARIYYNINA